MFFFSEYNLHFALLIIRRTEAGMLYVYDFLLMRTGIIWFADEGGIRPLSFVMINHKGNSLVTLNITET